MSDTTLTPEHQDFYKRFKSFWAATFGSAGARGDLA